MLTKKWEVNDCRIKVSKKITQNEKLFNRYLRKSKHLLVGTWHVTFYFNTFESGITFFFDKKSVLAKK